VARVRRAPGPGLGLWVVVGLMSVASSHAHAQAGHRSSVTIRSFELRLDNINRAVKRLARDFAEPVAIIREHPLETRVIEAKILYEVSNYEGASVVLLDLIANPRFQTQSEYPMALFMVGHSMKELGNLRASARYLKKAARLGEGQLRDKAQLMLIDMALNDDDDQRLVEIVDNLTGSVSGQGSVKTRYALGKALIRLERYDQAITMLSGLVDHASWGDRARFYLATAHTALKRYDEALAEFAKLATLSDPDSADLRDLSQLALGRLRMEQGDLAGAITSYQRIARTSEHFEVALYEMSWGYIKGEQYDKALATIDTLLLIVKDPVLDVEAHGLRGRLNIYMNEYDRAVTSFEEIVGRFAPIRNELLAFTAEEGSVNRYFEWLLERRASDARLDAPLTARTAAWVEASGDMRRVASVFDSLSDQRRQIRLTQEIAVELEQIVRAQNRVELFPTLKDGWTRALVLQNQLVMLASAILNSEHGMTHHKIDGEDRTELEGLVNWRRRLEGRFRGMPMTFEQFAERKKRIDDRFLDLKRQAFLVVQRLKAVRRQVLALEGYVNDKQFTDGRKKFSEAEERGLRDDILQEKDNLKSLFDEVDSLDKELQLSSNEVGTGDVASQDEADLRATLIASFKREGNFYDRMTIGPMRPDARDINGLSSVLEQIWLALSALDRVVRAINQEVESKVSELYGLIRSEVIHLEEFMVEMSEQDDEGREIGRMMGRELFDAAMVRMDEVVLSAELGLIDVAWQEKRERSEEIRDLQNKRAKRLGKLSRALNQLTEGDEEDL
jgi:tetratricopeptide (TPR) repeat protein